LAAGSISIDVYVEKLEVRNMRNCYENYDAELVEQN